MLDERQLAAQLEDAPRLRQGANCDGVVHRVQVIAAVARERSSSAIRSA
jgi:hypothetical protein